MSLEMAAQRFRNQQMKDPFFKFFQASNRPDGKVIYTRRLSRPPGVGDPTFKEPGVTREAADIYKTKTGNSYTGRLIMPEAKDTTYAKSSFAKVVTSPETGQPVINKQGKTTPSPAASLGGGSKQVQKSRTQRSLFGGNVRDLMPSQRRDLTRRRAARASAAKTKKTLGV